MVQIIRKDTHTHMYVCICTYIYNIGYTLRRGRYMIYRLHDDCRPDVHTHVAKEIDVYN